jgi:hypothetical protein
MEVLTEDGLQKWCGRLRNAIRLGRHGLLSFTEGDAFSAVIEVPPGGEERIALARSLLTDHTFYGGMLWIKEWNIGDLQTMSTGWRIVERMRSAMGQPCPLESAPAQLFRLDEFTDAHAFLALVLLWGWQAFWVPATPGYFFYLHHNDKIEINASTDDKLTELSAYLSAWRPAKGSVLGLPK